MGQKIVVGPLSKGLRNDVTAFNVDNDAFPTLINAYQWRGRIKRKRGTSPFGRLNLYLGTTDGSGNLTVTIDPFPLEDGVSQFIVGSNIFTDGTVSSGDPVTLITTGPGTATLDRGDGVLTITGSNASTPVYYYPGLPVLGLEPFVSDSSFTPQQVAFDTTYSYNVPLGGGNFYNVSFYNNPATSALYPGYVAKTTWTPLNWNLADYQQMWTTNYSGAMWTIPGINATNNPTTSVGMQFLILTSATLVSATTTDVDFVVNNTPPNPSSPLVAGDFVFINEVTGINGLNYESGYILPSPAPSSTTFRARFPTATITGGPGSGGIAQALTNTIDPTKDCIRWYNGSMTDFPSSLVPNQLGFGWVNFSPPLTSGTPGNFSIADLPPSATPYYLVGARMVVPFKDRLIFFGPIVQLSSASSTPIYLPDTIIYSQNGTPYYTASFPYGSVNPSLSVLAAVAYLPILVPINQTATATSWWEDATGYGGFLSAGYSRPITTVSINEDALIVGFTERQTRLLYTGNDIVPFNFYVINSELGSDSTFSSITLDRGVISFGGRGIVLTSQTSSQRIDLEIPDEIFKIVGTTASSRSICAQRDFINEWIQFTYPSNSAPWSFPDQTLQYNYRDGSWAIFKESYTTYGTIRIQKGLTWSSATFPWNSASIAWNSGTDTIGQPLIYAGNAQGYVVLKGEQPLEAPSLSIQNIIQFGGTTMIVSPNHCLNDGDYITIQNVQGTLAPSLNQQIFVVQLISQSGPPDYDPDNFNITLAASGTYLGGGSITRMYVPFIQTRQFPVSWDMARKTRLGPQQYLFTRTPNGKITLLIFLSQNDSSAYNDPNYPYPVVLVPDADSENNSLVYSTVLYTCPESTNLGLSAANINLQMVTGQDQRQIWHRMNTSLLGDTVQIGFTMDNAQMLDLTFSNQFVEIELHSFILDVQPSQVLA